MTAEPSANVMRHLVAAAERHPDRPALRAGGGREPVRELTFAALLDRSRRFAAGLRRDGLREGDRTIVMVPMSIELYVALLGLLQLGAVAVFVDPWIGARRIARFAAYAEPRAFIGLARAHLLRLFHRSLRTLPVTVTTGRRGGPFPARRTWAELLEAPPDPAPFAAAPDDPALITFTSGSSGEPKGANRTHGLLDAQHRALAETFPYPDDAVDLMTFPVFGLNSLASGLTCVIPEVDLCRIAAVDAPTVLRQCERFGVTHLTASPPFFDRLCAELRSRGASMPWRRILTGGAPVHDAQLRAWREVLPDTDIQVVYGSTEAEPVAHCPAEERLAARSSRGGFCCGGITPALRSRLVRIHPGPIRLDDGNWKGWEVPRDEIGELLVSGDHVCRDYFRNPEAVAENKVVDGSGSTWHRLGDTGYFDEEDRFWLTGRVHSSIPRDGGWVHPQLVEQAARGDDPAVRRCAALGLSGERIAVVVESDDPGAAKRVRQRLDAAGFPCDELVVTAEALPVDPRHNAKIDYPALRARLEKTHGY